MDDSKIIDMYLERDEEAIRLTSEKYGGKLRRLARNICADEMMAEECENDTYLGAWRSIPPHEPRNYFPAFLMRITRALAIDRVKYLTRKKRTVRMTELSREIEESVASVRDVESEYEEKMLSRAISRFLWEQPAEKRDIFIRRYFYMDSIEEIARRYSISKGKTKSILFRLRNSMREYLEQEGFTL